MITLYVFSIITEYRRNIRGCRVRWPGSRSTQLRLSRGRASGSPSVIVHARQVRLRVLLMTQWTLLHNAQLFSSPHACLWRLWLLRRLSLWNTYTHTHTHTAVTIVLYILLNMMYICVNVNKFLLVNVGLKSLQFSFHSCNSLQDLLLEKQTNKQTWIIKKWIMYNNEKWTS